MLFPLLFPLFFSIHCSGTCSIIPSALSSVLSTVLPSVLSSALFFDLSPCSTTFFSILCSTLCSILCSKLYSITLSILFYPQFLSIETCKLHQYYHCFDHNFPLIKKHEEQTKSTLKHRRSVNLVCLQPPNTNPGDGQDHMAFTFKIFGHSKKLIIMQHNGDIRIFCNSCKEKEDIPCDPSHFLPSLLVHCRHTYFSLYPFSFLSSIHNKELEILSKQNKLKIMPGIVVEKISQNYEW